MTFVWRLGVLQLLDFFKFLELCLSIMGLVLLPYVSENVYKAFYYITQKYISPQMIAVPRISLSPL
uniref:Uncharacterized protein n=1 Tax=Macaca fascicularis TaxID=9541 RepID=A0A2K5V2W8_MACFA